MEINFNEGKKELNNTSETESQEQMISEDGEIITDFEEEDTDYTQVKSSIDKDELKGQIKKVLVVAGVILGVLVLIILMMSLFVKKEYSYSDIEEIMEKACQKYFVDYANYLPKEVNDTRNVPVENLVEGKYMKDLSTYLKEGVTCTGRVTVQKLTEGYDYKGYLNCGDNYETTELYKKVTKEDNLKTSGYGLYSLYGNYVFRGEEVDNYVKLNGYLWRIVKVTSDGNIALIFNDKISLSSLPWDDRYNKAKDYNIGNNNYSTSRVKENLAKLYNGTLDETITILKSKHRAYLTEFDLCVGKRAQNDKTNNNATECSEKETSQQIGLLTVSEYMQASLDNNCNSTLSESCQNYNYLNTDYNWWLATADKSNSYDAYHFATNLGVQVKHASSQAYLRPVVYLKSNVFYNGGKGTKTDPYKIK